VAAGHLLVLSGYERDERRVQTCELEPLTQPFVLLFELSISLAAALVRAPGRFAVAMFAASANGVRRRVHLGVREGESSCGTYLP
jgi:hypothetical protein